MCLEVSRRHGYCCEEYKNGRVLLRTDPRECGRYGGQRTRERWWIGGGPSPKGVLCIFGRSRIILATGLLNRVN